MRGFHTGSIPHQPRRHRCSESRREILISRETKRPRWTRWTPSDSAKTIFNTKTRGVAFKNLFFQIIIIMAQLLSREGLRIHYRVAVASVTISAGKTVIKQTNKKPRLSKKKKKSPNGLFGEASVPIYRNALPMHHRASGVVGMRRKQFPDQVLSVGGPGSFTLRSHRCNLWRDGSLRRPSQ